MSHDPLCRSTVQDRVDPWDCGDCALIVSVQGRAVQRAVKAMTRQGCDDFAIGAVVGAITTAGIR